MLALKILMVTLFALTSFINNHADKRVMIEIDINGRINIESSETVLQEASGSGLRSFDCDWVWC